MPTYFASDVHLRLDKPERSERFARWVRTLSCDDVLVVVGDLCDFWFASRQLKQDPWTCAGLRSVRDFRSGGGKLLITAGNHDCWLGPFYEEKLGAEFHPDDLLLETEGFRVRAVHGHMLGARAPWKGVMESRWFLDFYALAPSAAAEGLARLLVAANERVRAESDRRHLEIYRQYCKAHINSADLFIFGHIHASYEEPIGSGKRLLILGSWLQAGNYARISGGEFEYHANI